MTIGTTKQSRLCLFSISHQHRFSQSFEHIALFSATGMFLFPLWPQGFINTAIWIAMSFMILAGNWKNNIRNIVNNPVAISMILLTIVFWLGTTYSIADSHKALHMAKHYSWLIYPVVLFPLFYKFFNPGSRHHLLALNLFILAALSISIIAILELWFGWQLNFLVTHSKKLEFGPPLAFAGFIAAHLCRHARSVKFKIVLLFELIIISYGLLFAMSSRTGFICYFILAVLFATQGLHWKRIIIGMISIAALLFTVLHFSPHFSRGISQADQSITTLKQSGNTNTSVGLRVQMLKSGFILLSKRPILGYGTGAYGTAYHNEFDNPKNHYHVISWKNIYNSYAGIHSNIYLSGVTNPHNEYMLIAVQLGVVGLMTFIGMLLVMFAYSYTLPHLQRYIAQGLVVVFSSSCFSGALLYSNLRFYFLILAGLLFFSAATGKKQQSGHK